MNRARAVPRLLAVISVAWMSGCAVVGPASLRAGRMAYNEAIAATNDQQVLATIVRMRYGEAAELLAVSSITASMQVRASAGSEVGFGPSSNYDGNLVPLSVGVAYEENPTISYVPVQGEKHMRQLLSPLPLDLTVLLLNSMAESPHAMTLLLQSINGLPNPARLHDGLEPDGRFARLAELLAAMGRAGRARWVADSDGHALVLAGGAEAAGQRSEVIELLGISEAPQGGELVVLPVTAGLGAPQGTTVWLDPRSMWELLNIAAAQVQVPPEHFEAGLAAPLPPAGPVGSAVRIRSSRAAPATALVAVKQDGWWFFIERTDPTSKLTFRVLAALVSVRTSEAVEGDRSAPVLTVPVSR